MDNEKSLKSIKLYRSVKTELERLIDTMIAPIGRDPDEEVNFPFDMYIEQDLLIIEVEMPGLDKDSIRIDGMDKFLEISGIKDTVKSKYKNCNGLERLNGSFKKLIYLEHSVNLYASSASIEDGILTIRLPIVEEKRGKKSIPIQ